MSEGAVILAVVLVLAGYPGLAVLVLLFAPRRRTRRPLGPVVRGGKRPARPPPPPQAVDRPPSPFGKG